MNLITATSLTGISFDPNIIVAAPNLAEALKELERNHPGARPEVVYQFRGLFYFAPSEVKREVTR